MYTLKSSEVRKLALEAGLRTEAIGDLDLLDFDSLQVEVTDQGRYIVHGGKEFIETLKHKRPHWFKQNKPPAVNAGGGGTPATGSGKLVPADVVNAERQYRRGKISKEEYLAIGKKYMQQK